MNDTHNPANEVPGDQSAASTQPDASFEDSTPTDDQNVPEDEAQEESTEEKQEADAEAEAKRVADLDKETEDDLANKPLDAEVWGSTGHPIADEVMRTLQNVGMSTDDAKELLLEAVLTRDPDMVDQKALASKIGPRRVKVIMDGLETFSREMRPKDRRLTDEVYQHTNGPNAYRHLIQQATNVLSQSKMQGYLTQIAKGGSSAQRAIESLQSRVSGKTISLDRHVHTEQYSKLKPVARPASHRVSRPKRMSLRWRRCMHPVAVSHLKPVTSA